MLWLIAVAALLSRPSDPQPRSTAAADSQIAADLAAHPDTAALLAHPGVATRSGRVLRIGDLRFVDEGVCDGSGCVRYRFDRVWPGGYAGIIDERDESRDYWMVKAPNDATAIGAAPIASPSGRYLFVGFLDELSGSSATDIPSGIAIWRSRDISRLRVIDPPILAFDRFLAWHGDGCVAFLATPGHGPAASAPRFFWLVEDRIDWTLHDRRPASCPAG